MKNIDEWVEWMTRNPELAEKHYPEIMQGITERIKNSEPYLMALIIQKLPDHFPNWKTETEKHIGIKRKKMIQGYIDLIKAVLIEYEYPSEIEQQAVESVRAELTEQMEYWNKQIDTRFWLTTFFEEQEQTKHEYKSFKWGIEKRGCFTVKTGAETVKIYTPELAVIFTSKELPARNMDTQTETSINGGEYLKTYIEAYKEGEQYFETEFKVSPNTLYGANADQYVKDIHLNFFHVKHTGINEGWSYVKRQYPFVLTHKTVKEFGYYSGIVNKVEEQVKKYPKQFAAFDKCELNIPPQQTETKTDKLKVPQLALIHIYEGIQITRENAGDIAAKHGYTAKNSGEGLFQDYTNYCSTANRKGKPTPCTPKKLKNKIELFESVVNHLSDNNKQKAIDEIKILKTIFENEYQ